MKYLFFKDLKVEEYFIGIPSDKDFKTGYFVFKKIAKDKVKKLVDGFVTGISLDWGPVIRVVTRAKKGGE